MNTLNTYKKLTIYIVKNTAYFLSTLLNHNTPPLPWFYNITLTKVKKNIIYDNIYLLTISSSMYGLFFLNRDRKLRTDLRHLTTINRDFYIVIFLVFNLIPAVKVFQHYGRSYVMITIFFAIFFCLLTTTEWNCWKDEPDAKRHGKNNAHRIRSCPILLGRSSEVRSVCSQQDFHWSTQG